MNHETTILTTLGGAFRLFTISLMSPVNVPQPLTSFAAGVVVHLAFFALGDSECQRLRDLGVREGNEIHVLKNDDTFVCKIDASRIALRREVAMNVFATSPGH